MFTMIGRFRGKSVEVSWDDGEFASPNELLLTQIEERIRFGGPVLQTPVGPEFKPAAKPDYVALLVIESVLDSVDEEHGTAPVFPDDGLPADAIS